MHGRRGGGPESPRRQKLARGPIAHPTPKPRHAGLSIRRQAPRPIQGRAQPHRHRLHDRLVKRIHLLLKEEVDPNRLHQEAAILADKADISEELSRMKSHCRQFESALSSDEPVGRRLDFLTQEMNREVNTISSKTVDHPIRARVIDMKSTLEKIKEQAANIE